STTGSPACPGAWPTARTTTASAPLACTATCGRATSCGPARARCSSTRRRTAGTRSRTWRCSRCSARPTSSASSRPTTRPLPCRTGGATSSACTRCTRWACTWCCSAAGTRPSSTRCCAATRDAPAGTCLTRPGTTSPREPCRLAGRRVRPGGSARADGQRDRHALLVGGAGGRVLLDDDPLGRVGGVDGRAVLTHDLRLEPRPHEVALGRLQDELGDVGDLRGRGGLGGRLLRRRGGLLRRLVGRVVPAACGEQDRRRRGSSEAGAHCSLHERALLGVVSGWTGPRSPLWP